MVKSSLKLLSLPYKLLFFLISMARTSRATVNNDNKRVNNDNKRILARMQNAFGKPPVSYDVGS